MFELKPISKDAIPEALHKAHRYRLLNEPMQAQSICLDVLRVEPANQLALTTLLLSLTDQFGGESTPAKAREVLARLTGDYDRHYYGGIICERAGHAAMKLRTPGGGHKAHDLFREAMGHYEKAEAIRPAGHDDAILRWNTCARILMRLPDVKPMPVEREVVLDD